VEEIDDMFGAWGMTTGAGEADPRSRQRCRQAMLSVRVPACLRNVRNSRSTLACADHRSGVSRRNPAGGANVRGAAGVRATTDGGFFAADARAPHRGRGPVAPGPVLRGSPRESDLPADQQHRRLRRGQAARVGRERTRHPARHEADARSRAVQPEADRDAPEPREQPPRSRRTEGGRGQARAAGQPRRARVAPRSPCAARGTTASPAAPGARPEASTDQARLGTAATPPPRRIRPRRRVRRGSP